MIFNKKVIILVLVSMILSAIYTIWINQKYKNFYLFAKEDIYIKGIIISDKEEKEYYNKYIIKSVFKENKGKKFIVYINKNISLEYGDLVSLQGAYYAPDGAKNYKGFNYKNYLKSQKIYGTIKASEIDLIEKNKANLFFTISHKIRNKILENIKKLLPEENSGFLMAFILGEKDYISEENIEAFRTSSLAHVLAVSGAHISYIILGITYALDKSKIPKKAGYIIIILILFCYMFIADFTPSVVRACLMGIIMITSKITYSKLDVYTSIAISLLILIIYNPFIINDIGLQLSYGGTIGIVLLSKIVYQKIELVIDTKTEFMKTIMQSISVVISAQIIIFPITIIHFNTISLTFWISNLVAMPLLGTSIILGLIIVMISFIYFPIAKFIANYLNLILEILKFIAQSVSKISLSKIYVKTPYDITIIIYYLLVLFFSFKPKKLKKHIRKLHIIIILIVIIVNIVYLETPKGLKIFFIDVGQRRQHSYYNPNK